VSKPKPKCPNCGKTPRYCKCRPSEVAMVVSRKDAENRLKGAIKSLQPIREVGLPPHIIVEARAGTGKTTTLVEGLKRVKGLPSRLTPSPQQAAVWEAMASSKDAKTICFVAFNKAIAEELKNRVPGGCEAMTMHSMGFKAVQKFFGRVDVNSYRVQDVIAELLETDIRNLRREKPVVLKATEDLVNLCKMNLCNGPHITSGSFDDELLQLAAYYDIDLDGQAEEVFALVPRVLERCKDVGRDGKIDFADMIWLPVALNLPVFKYDLLLVDESQDLNRCQQALAMRAGKRLVLCGDPKQAIYGFAGADAESMPRMEKELGLTDRGVVHLPLTVTRRCGKRIVEEAKRIVPDFDAFETNPEGLIDRAHYPVCGGPSVTYDSLVEDGDMILCRVNAPLVSQCFRFLKAGRKANIQGRDVGQGLISTINKLKAASVERLVRRVSDWLNAEECKENAKRCPSEAKLIALRDRHDCLVCFTEGAETVNQVIAKINAVFTDDKNGAGIRLSSVHKAKGLEARCVFLLEPQGATIPHPMVRSEWQREQEMNLRYVAITRAIEKLVYVS